MSYRRTSSLGAKLFYYMSSLVVITIVGLSWQFYLSFKVFQTNQVQDNIQIQAEKAASSLEVTLEGWKTLLAASLPNLRNADRVFEKAKLQEFLDSNSEFIQMELATAIGPQSTQLSSIVSVSTSNLSGERFEGQKPEAVIKKLKDGLYPWFKRSLSTIKSSNIMVGNASSLASLPVTYLALRFDVEKSEKVLWVLLTAWQTNLTRSLPKSKSVDSYVIEDRQRVFSSSNTKLITNQESLPSELLKSLKLKQNHPAGYIDEFKNASGRRRVGAYSRLPKYKLTAVIEQDVEFAYEETFRNLINTGLWALLFILIAVLMSYFGATNITRGLREMNIATAKIASGDFNYRIEPRTSDEVGSLSLAINHMSERIVGLMKSQAERVRFEQELETAKMVQSTFFPKKDLANSFSKICGFYTPASECGGDLWGHFKIDQTKEFVFIADAMGHGAPAALVTAMAYSVIMTISDLFNQNTLEPKEILHKLNNIIFHAVEGTISMTAFAMILDYERRTVTYSNAGHNFPIFIPKDPHDIRCASSKAGSKKYTHKVGNMNVMGTILGIAANTEFNQKTMNILPGDKLFLFTDGLIECKSPTGQAWSRKNLTECLLENALLDGAKLKETVVNKAFSFFNKVPLLDDITVVVVEVLESLAQLPANDERKTSAETNVNSIAKLNVIKDTIPPVPAVPAAGHKYLAKDSETQPTEDLLARVKALRHKVS